MKRYDLTYKKLGESSILIEWPQKINPKIIQDIASFEKLVRKDQKVIETTIAYNSLMIQYEFMHNYTLHYKYHKSFERTVEKLKELYARERKVDQQRRKVWQVPVCYDLEFGLDLQEISQKKQLSISEIIELHTQSQYLIYFLGFQPGFLYLGGLDERIHMPRKANPRLRVDKGSVAIGGEQTGIYPHDSSGGWNIIGKSPINFFDISKSKPCFASAGEKIQFVPINKDEYNRILEEDYELKFDWL